METGAGLVIIYDQKILLEHPTGQKWFGTYSIPKGGLEKDEDKIAAAIRETKEEIGIQFLPDQIDPDTEGHIDYTDKKGNIYKRVYYYVVKVPKELHIDKSKLQKDEIDWAGWLTLEEAEKRIFWRYKSILKYLK
jgi:predicted NUDIX family NTP pyrophosphohydrolase